MEPEQDKTVLPAPISAVQPETVVETPESGSESTEQPSLTKAEVLKVVEEALKTSKDDIVRSAVSNFQSLTDKAEQRIRQRYDEQIQLLQKTGLQLDDGQKETIEKEIRKTVTKEDSPASPEGKPETGIVDKAVVATVNKRMIAINQKYKTALVENDPEVQMVDYTEPDFYKFIDDYEAAIKAKAGRVMPETEESPDDEDGAIARSPHSGRSAGSDGNASLSALQLIKKGYAEHRKKR